MIWLALAQAAEIVDDGSLVHGVTWARPFTLQQAHPYRYQAEKRSITVGWLVEVQVEPWTMQPRQVGVPNLWIGDQIAGRTRWGGGCAVVWVPGDPDLSRVFFGTTGLAEQVDAARKAEILAQAARLPGVPTRDIVGPTLQVEGYSALMQVAATRCPTER